MKKLLLIGALCIGAVGFGYSSTHYLQETVDIEAEKIEILETKVSTKNESIPKDIQMLEHFVGIDIEGKEHKSSEYLSDKPLVLNFWTLSCGACRYEMPFLDTYAIKNKDRVSVVAVTSDDRISMKMYQLNNNFEGIEFISSDHGAYGDNLVDRIPTTFVVNKEGEVLYKHTGAIKFEDSDELVKKVEELLK